MILQWSKDFSTEKLASVKDSRFRSIENNTQKIVTTRFCFDDFQHFLWMVRIAFAISNKHFQPLFLESDLNACELFSLNGEIPGCICLFFVLGLFYPIFIGTATDHVIKQSVNDSTSSSGRTM